MTPVEIPKPLLNGVIQNIALPDAGLLEQIRQSYGTLNNCRPEAVAMLERYTQTPGNRENKHDHHHDPTRRDMKSQNPRLFSQ